MSGGLTDEQPPALRQLCACEKRELSGAGTRPVPRWPGYDFNLKAELCRLCAAEVLWSGHRYCVWFCGPCKDAVREANERLGGYMIPIGRHSVHAGVLVNPRRPRREGARQAEELVRFLTGSGERMEALERWRAGRVAGILAWASLASPAPLIDYLAVASEAKGNPKRLVERLLRPPESMHPSV